MYFFEHGDVLVYRFADGAVLNASSVFEDVVERVARFVVFHFDWDILSINFGEEGTKSLLCPLIDFVRLRVVAFKEDHFESIVAFIDFHILS